MSATAFGSRLIVRNSLVAYSPTAPAHCVEGPRRSRPSSSRQLPAVTVAASLTPPTLKPQPWLRSRGRLLQARCVHPPQFLLQVGDLVANPCGELALTVARRGHHLCSQVLDQIGQFRARHVRRVAALVDSGAHRAARLALGSPTARRGGARAPQLGGGGVLRPR